MSDFDENYLWHDFTYNGIKYDNFTCIKCGMIAFMDSDRIYYIANRWRGEAYYGLPNIELTLTCEEVIIKNIIE